MEGSRDHKLGVTLLCLQAEDRVKGHQRGRDPEWLRRRRGGGPICDARGATDERGVCAGHHRREGENLQVGMAALWEEPPLTCELPSSGAGARSLLRPEAVLQPAAGAARAAGRRGARRVLDERGAR